LNSSGDVHPRTFGGGAAVRLRRTWYTDATVWPAPIWYLVWSAVFAVGLFWISARLAGTDIFDHGRDLHLAPFLVTALGLTMVVRRAYLFFRYRA
jgi:hypothetical protein